MSILSFLPRPVFAPEGANAGADAGAAAASGASPEAAAAAEAAAAGAAAPDAGAAYRPEGLPDHLFGASDRETVDRLFKAYAGARDSIARAGEVPKDIAGYAFKPSEKVKPYAANLDADPFWATTKEIALKHGFPARQFSGFIGDVLEAMVDKNLVAEPFSPETERAALVPDVADPKARAVAADRIINENIALVKTWGEQGLPEDAAKALLATMDRAATNRLVDWIREGRGEQRPALGGAPAAGISETDLDARMTDPRNTMGSPQYDRAFAAETDRLFRQHYGT